MPKTSATKIRADQLPLYPEEDRLSNYRFLEEDPLPMQEGISKVRKEVQKKYSAFMERFGTAQRLVDRGTSTIQRTHRYIKEEGSVLPKAAAITVGGMAGFLFGMKRGGVVIRSYYSGLGMAVTAAFCYPHETVDLTRTAGRYAVQQWKDFQASPPAVQGKGAAVDKAKDLESLKLSPEEQGHESKDIDLYTTRSKKIE